MTVDERITEGSPVSVTNINLMKDENDDTVSNQRVDNSRKDCR